MDTMSLAPTIPSVSNANVTVEPSVEESKKCRDFVWGICTKGAQCKFRHTLDVESMKEILKFCHDYQNPKGCTRPACTYLHTSREEQELFLNTGLIPRVLAERYAAMPTAEMNMYASDYVVQAQQPPPPPPTTPAPPPALPDPRLTALLAPPPPPPPPPPQTTTTALVRMSSATYAGLTRSATPKVVSAARPPLPLLPLFDASRPPPPLPTNATVTKQNGATKRAAAPSGEDVRDQKTRPDTKDETSEDTRRACRICPPKKHRMTSHVCVGYIKPVSLQCSRPLCTDCQ